MLLAIRIMQTSNCNQLILPPYSAVRTQCLRPRLTNGTHHVNNEFTAAAN
jgi:hypothetical protein